MRTKLFTAAILLTQLAIPAFSADQWEIDPRHSQANFSIRHMMVSNVRGTIAGIKGTANYDGKNVKDLAVNAEMDVNSINTADADRDKHLKGADFFDVAKYPTITFKSEKVVQDSNGKFKLLGNLTMHGVTKPVELVVEGPTQIVKDPHGKERVGASASTRVNRQDYGIKYNSALDGGGLAVGNDVDITLDIEMTKQKAASEPSTKKAG